MYEFGPNTLYVDVTSRHFGQQHQGIAPMGASDQLSFETALTLLGHPNLFRCSEMLHVRHITFTEPLLIVLTGAHLDGTFLKQGENVQPLKHATVYAVTPGEEIHLETTVLGWRSYLCATPLTERNRYRAGLSRGILQQWFDPPPERLRLFRGAEYAILKNPLQFFQTSWQLSKHSGMMGITLEGSPLDARSYDIISSAVDDGTIQLTASGPIVLMRHRQTTGGYPRIFQLLASDIDCLAQLPLGSHTRFFEITIEEALELMQRRTEQWQNFVNAYM